MMIMTPSCFIAAFKVSRMQMWDWSLHVSSWFLAPQGALIGLYFYCRIQSIHPTLALEQSKQFRAVQDRYFYDDDDVNDEDTDTSDDDDDDDDDDDGDDDDGEVKFDKVDKDDKYGEKSIPAWWFCFSSMNCTQDTNKVAEIIIFFVNMNHKSNHQIEFAASVWAEIERIQLVLLTATNHHLHHHHHYHHHHYHRHYHHHHCHHHCHHHHCHRNCHHHHHHPKHPCNREYDDFFGARDWKLDALRRLMPCMFRKLANGARALLKKSPKKFSRKYFAVQE